MPRGSPTLMYVKQVRAKGTLYLYFDTGQRDSKGKKIFKRLPPKSDKSFGGAYAAMLGHRSRRTQAENPLLLKHFVDLYQGSAQYKKLQPSTQKLYRIYQQSLAMALGEGPAGEIERKDIILMLDRMADKPGAANMVLAAARALYTWGRKRGHVDNDPCRDIDMMEVGEHDAWPVDLVTAALAAEDDRVRLAVNLLYYTAQRIGDVCAMRWSHIGNDRIAVVQEKTGKVMEIPIHEALVAELAKHPRGLGTILNYHGKQIAAATLRKSIKGFCSARGFDIVPHGLRKNAVNALLEAGCSAAETAAISGQSLQMVEHYAKGRSQNKLASAAILKWEGAR
ncbi:site-specific integrase [Sphingobium sp. CECT 9361]|uniref:site-specific integrase n=1 Tax=Sphingobium sp. CECT 9361 TaxID=2845384 RepID=UPI001E39F0F0|nr:site-specific integrase [Sphingobium sp. CECT 9361]CAH0355352.1 Tyrosine recombinase XerC [Sphingobium sp. CECT 9361]